MFFYSLDCFDTKIFLITKIDVRKLLINDTLLVKQNSKIFKLNRERI